MQVCWRSIDEGEAPPIEWVSIREPDDRPPVAVPGCGIHFVDDDWRSIVEDSAPVPRPETGDRRLETARWRPLLAKAAAVALSLLGHGALALVLSLFIVLASSPVDDVIVVETHTREAADVDFAPPPPVPEPDLRALAATPVVDIPEQKPDAPLVDEPAAAAEESAPAREVPSRAWSPEPDSKRKPSVAKLDRVGAGGGSPRPTPQGGPFGGRGSGKLDLAKEGGGGQATEDAVVAALRWLARHQQDDGSWTVGSARSCCASNVVDYGQHYTPAVTGLAVLAFLGAGYGPESRDEHDGKRFGDVVRRGGEWLVRAQDEKGGIGGVRGRSNMYVHAIGAMALAELTGMSRDRDAWRAAAERAVKFTLEAQNVEGEYPSGWRYTPRCGTSDTTVTGWCMMSLKSAELAGIDFPKTAYTGVDRWIERCTDKEYYGVSYMPRAHTTAVTCAVGVLCRIWLKPDPTDARITVGTQTFLKQPGAQENDPYTLYQGSLMLFQQDGPRGELWRKWNERMKDYLVGAQCGADAGCRRGSWELTGHAASGGRAFVTAMNALTLEVYYRYPRAMLRDR